MDIESQNKQHLLDNIQNIISNIIFALEQMLSQTNLVQSKFITFFHTHIIPSISISNFLKSYFRLSGIQKYAKCSGTAYVLAMIYINKIQQKNSQLIVNGFCIHRLVITSVMIAAKFFDDIFYKNTYYAQVGGISVNQMNVLQQQFLNMINFELFVDQKQFWDFFANLFVNQ